MKKKILIVTEVFYPEEFKINDVALAWVARGYDIDVLTLTPTYPLGKVFSGYKNWFFRRDDFNNIKIFRLRAVSGYKNSKTKKIWKYIKKHDLQDAKNRRNINADDKLKPVFGGKKQVSMFEMTKLVNNHLS